MVLPKISLPIDVKILKALQNSSLSTNALAAIVRENNAKIYRRCCWLEENGWLNSTLVSNKRLLYCIDDRTVVTWEAYENCKLRDHDLRTFFNKMREWSLSEGMEGLRGNET